MSTIGGARGPGALTWIPEVGQAVEVPAVGTRNGRTRTWWPGTVRTIDLPYVVVIVQRPKFRRLVYSVDQIRPDRRRP